MAASGTPKEGRDKIISDRVYTSGTLDLRCYVNAQDSLDADSVFGDLVEPTGTGYAPISLTGTFSETDGVVTYDHGTPDDPVFQNTESAGGSNWSQPVSGVAMTDGSYILHFVDIAAGQVTMTPGKKLRVDISNLVAP